MFFVTILCQKAYFCDKKQFFVCELHSIADPLQYTPIGTIQLCSSLRFTELELLKNVIYAAITRVLSNFAPNSILLKWD